MTPGNDCPHLDHFLDVQALAIGIPVGAGFGIGISIKDDVKGWYGLMHLHFPGRTVIAVCHRYLCIHLLADS